MPLGGRMETVMKKNMLLIILVVLLFTLVGCGSDGSDISNVVSNDGSSDATITQSTDGNAESDAEGSFVWPNEIPVNLQNFEGATFSTYAKDTFAENAWTLYFECSDKQKVDDYIKTLENLGYKQDNYSSNDFGLDYYGLGTDFDVKINYVTGGLSKLYISMITSDGAGNEGVPNGSSSESATWPEEFASWNVPIIEGATLKTSTNVSATSAGLTQGSNVVVTLDKISRSSFDTYIKSLEGIGFVKNNGESLGDIMLIYDKSVDGGDIKMTMFYSEDVTTITAYNSAAAAEKESQAGGSVVWPESVKAIPSFTKGKYKETIGMGGGMYAITYLNVTAADLDWYRNTLKKAGFEKQEGEDTEGYFKIEQDATYSVGFSLEGDNLQLVVLSGTY